jgi:glycosyltransferase involved in cell wall biosynthesis
MAGHGPDRPLRVLHVTPGLDLGGLEKLLVEFARHADRRRYTLQFVSLGTRGEFGAALESCGWPVTALGQGLGLRPGLVPRLAALCRRWRPDVVHTHNTRALVYAGPAARLARVPWHVHTWHGRDLLGALREKLLLRLAGKLPDRVVAVSEDAARLMVREGIGAARVRTIWNGIDLERFAYAGPCPGGPLVTVARLSPEKDVATLVRAAARICRERPGLALEVAGDGPCLPQLRGLAHELGLNGNVRFLGQVGDVAGLLARASLFVLPSLTEGVSLTLLEAMARGLPVVATNVGGNPEVVADGQTGLLVPPGDPEALTRAVLQVESDAEAGRRMGDAGRRRVEQHFDVRGMVAAYEALYREGPAPRPSSAAARRPRVVSNMPGLSRPPAADVLANRYRDMGVRSVRAGVRAALASLSADAVVIDQDSPALLTVCALRALLPLPWPPLVSVDLVLAPPEPTPAGRVKNLLKRWLLGRVDLFLVHMKDTRAWTKYYGIPPGRTRYVPFKVNGREFVLARAAPEGDYVFTGGKSRRDYETFCAALARTGYPARVVTPRPEENAVHGTRLDVLAPPPNVTVVHDDGSPASWVHQIAGARLVVFCIAPETISPSGVSAYLIAMALKKCVIISDCPATRGILVGDETAVLVPMRDPEALAQALRQAWTDDAYRRRVAEGGYRYALSLGGEETLMGNVGRAVLELVSRQRH